MRRIAGIKKQDSLLQKNSKIQIEKNWLYQNSKPVKKHSRIEESKSSFRSFRGSKTRKQIPSNPSLPRNKSHHPPGCRCKWPSPNLRMGQPLPPATGVVYNAFQRIILRQSKGLRSPRFLHPPLRVPEFTEKEREREWKTAERIHSHLPQGWPRSYARPGNSLCRNVKRVERVTKDSGVNESLKRETRGWHT